MKIRLVMRDDDYCKAFIKAIQKYNQDLYIESGKDFSVNEGTLIVTDYNIRHFDMKIVENNRGGVVFILSREVPDKLRSREVGPFFIFKYDGMEKIMASLNMAYSIWRGDEQIQKMGCKVVSVFSDSRGEKSTFISKLIARQSVYRLNLKVLIIPMAFISELPSGNIESGAFMKLVYCIDLKRKLSREALFYKDNYDVEYFRMPKGINPLTAFGEEKLQEMDAQIPMRSIKNQIANAIEIYVHLARDKEGTRKVMEVAEMSGFNGEDYELNYLFERSDDGVLIRTNNALIHNEKLIRGYS